MDQEDLITVVRVATGEVCGEVGFPRDPRPLKYFKPNPIGENVYLLPDGTIERDEDKIIFLQRLWKEKAYAPDIGVMFMKGLKRFRDEVQDQSLRQ